MRLTERERQRNREAFRAMGLAEKADYVFSYYKLPLVIALIVLVATGSIVHRVLTRKDTVLYVALTNVVPPADVEARLTTDYVESTGRDTRTDEVSLYRELRLTEDASLMDHQYAYASRLKLMAAAEDRKVDVALMNRESWDLLSAAGYLLDLESLLPDDDALRTNTVVLESNQVEVDLNEADELEVKTAEAANALEVTDAPLFGGFSGGEPLYIGIFANTTRTHEALRYLTYVVHP